jgi:hypothetical protein
MAYLAGVASVDWACAVQIMAAASIGSGLKFAPTTQQTLYAFDYLPIGHSRLTAVDSGVYAALLISHTAICTLTVKVIARLQKFYVALNVL